jgi:hypothetical protein
MAAANFVVKLSHKSVTVRRQGASFADVLAHARESFPEVPDFHFVYTDEDGDDCRVSCQSDLSEALQVAREMCSTTGKRPVLKMRVVGERESLCHVTRAVSLIFC